ncbi:unnamed protein product [Amaranthus hypochondriacus]
MAPTQISPQIMWEASMLLDQLDEQRGRKSRVRPSNHLQARPQSFHAYGRTKTTTTTTTIIDSENAAERFGGVMVCDYYVKPTKKPSSYAKAYYW